MRIIENFLRELTQKRGFITTYNIDIIIANVSLLAFYKKIYKKKTKEKLLIK